MNTNHGFRKDPFKSKHLFMAAVAIPTASFYIRYNGSFTRLVGKWDLDIDLSTKYPNYVNNFFGLGNESEFNQLIDDGLPYINNPVHYYRIRYTELNYKASLKRRITNNLNFSIGPEYLDVEIKESKGGPRFIEEYEEAIGEQIIEKNDQYFGLYGALNYDKRDHQQLPTKGFRWLNRYRALADIDEGHNSLASFDSEMSFYYSFQLPTRLTFAARVGGGINFGDYKFYNAQIISGKTELRGYRKTRFYGDSRFYSNLEMRLRLSTIKTSIIPITMGVNGFFDAGRVWLEGEDSNKMHKGFGGGIWLSPLDVSVISFELGSSEESLMFYFRLGFLF